MSATESPPAEDEDERTSAGEGERALGEAEGEDADGGEAGAESGSSRLPAALEALRYRDFRLFWIGGFVSGVGRFFQFVAIPAVIWNLTGSPGWVGFGGFAQFISMALVAPVAGPLADHHSRRRMLLVTQSGQALMALGLAVAWWSGVREPAAYVAMSVLVGLSAGLNLPAWQAFVSELVPRPVLLNAVTLNSTQFNASRLIGPMLAGATLVAAGPGTAFLINSVSFLAVIAALVMIRTPGAIADDTDRIHPARDFAATLAYIRGQSGIATAVGAVVLIGMFGLSIQVLVIVFAEGVFGRDESGYGLMLTMIGAGAVAAAPFVTSLGGRFRRSRVQAFALLAYGLAVMALAAAPVFWMALVALAVMGASHLTSAAMLNTTIQLQVEEHRRAQVIAVYMMALLLANPVGQLVLSQLIELIGPRPTFGIAGATLVAATLVLRASGRLSRLDLEGGRYEPRVLAEFHPTTPTAPNKPAASPKPAASG